MGHQFMMNKILNFFSRRKDKSAEKLKVRVLPFGRDKIYYYIQYKLPNSFVWKRYNAGFFSFSFDLWDIDHPHLDRDFEKTVEFAKSLTEEKILENDKKLLERYHEGEEAFKKERESRNKKWESE